MSSTPSDPGPRRTPTTAPATTLSTTLATVLATTLAAVTSATLLAGCMDNPHPKPLVVATAASTTTTAPPTTPTNIQPTDPSTVTPTGTPTGISGPEPEPALAPPPKRITGRQVARAAQHAGIPGLRVVTQPSPRARLGTHAILYTHAASYATTIRIHEVAVRLVAAPVSYTWHFGDGAVRTTTTPGAPYPNYTLTHVYRSPGVFHPDVTTTYRVRYRLPGGVWRDLPRRYTAPGPTTALTIVRDN